jgi:hypothetical protein
VGENKFKLGKISKNNKPLAGKTEGFELKLKFGFLSFGELEPFSSPWLSGFLSFFFAGISSEMTSFL